MARSDYRWSVCLFRQDGTSLGEVPVDVDWAPAEEWGRFLGIRQGRLSADAIVTDAVIEPRWHPTAGQPCVSALSVLVSQGDGRRACCEVPSAYFSGLAREVSAALVEKGVLRDGEYFRYLVGAYARGPQGQGQPEAALPAIQEVCPPLPLMNSRLTDFARRAVPFGQGDNPGDMPVFLPQEVLDETAFLSRQAGALETGGILIGHVHRDAALPELFVEVTAQVTARHSRSELMRLTFTPETWSAVSASIKLRKRGEIMVGWWHSHSYLKQPEKTESGKPARAATPDDSATLSAEDLSLHRTCFPRAYSLALLVAEGRHTGLAWLLHGWNAGMICQRSFRVLPRADWLAGETVATPVGEEAHA